MAVALLAATYALLAVRTTSKLAVMQKHRLLWWFQAGAAIVLILLSLLSFGTGNSNAGLLLLVLGVCGIVYPVAMLSMRR